MKKLLFALILFSINVSQSTANPQQYTNKLEEQVQILLKTNWGYKFVVQFQDKYPSYQNIKDKNYNVSEWEFNAENADPLASAMLCFHYLRQDIQSKAFKYCLIAYAQTEDKVRVLDHLVHAIPSSEPQMKAGLHHYLKQKFDYIINDDFYSMIIDAYGLSKLNEFSDEAEKMLIQSDSEYVNLNVQYVF